MFKIMIVEDDEKIRKIVADTLTKRKYDVVGIMEFDHILDDFEKFQPDLVLLDINLPTFDGLLLVSADPCNLKCAHTVPFL